MHARCRHLVLKAVQEDPVIRRHASLGCEQVACKTSLFHFEGAKAKPCALKRSLMK